MGASKTETVSTEGLRVAESKGAFIVGEGIDGSGKSLALRNLARRLQKTFGVHVSQTEEPNRGPFYQMLRSQLSGENVSNLELQLMFCIDRAQHVRKIINTAMSEGRWVICDRYHLSTVAYGASHGLDLEALLGMSRLFTAPDVTLLFKVSPEVGFARLEARGGVAKKERFERLESLKRTAAVYDQISGRVENCYQVNAAKPIASVGEQAWHCVVSGLLAKGILTI